MTLEHDMFPDWVMETFYKLAEIHPFGADGRIKLGFALDGTHMPPKVLTKLFDEVRRAGSHLITFHAVHGAMFDTSRPSMVEKLANSDIIRSDFLLSHANNLSVDDIDSIRAAGAHISSTPLTELQMGHGNPVCLDDDFYGIASLGVDCHSACSSSMPTQMMAVLQWQRAARHAQLEGKGQWATSNTRTVEEVYNLGTILGARAIHLDEEIGSLRVGKKADIVLFNRNTPSMLAAADRDPIASIVLHSSIRDIETVIIDGVVRKTTGVLKDVSIPGSLSKEQMSDGHVAKWADVVQAVQQSCEAVEDRISKHVNSEVTREGVIEGFHLNRDGIYGSERANGW